MKTAPIKQYKVQTNQKVNFDQQMNEVKESAVDKKTNQTTEENKTQSNIRSNKHSVADLGLDCMFQPTL